MNGWLAFDSLLVVAMAAVNCWQAYRNKQIARASLELIGKIQELARLNRAMER